MTLRGETLDLGADARQAAGIAFLEKSNELLAHDATQVPGAAGLRSAHQGTQLHGVFAGVGHLEIPDLAIPQRRGFEDRVTKKRRLIFKVYQN